MVRVRVCCAAGIIIRLGHVSGVTDARFSGLGDRILTASMEDGTARIYSWGPRFSNVKHVVLKVQYGFFNFFCFGF